MNDRDTLWDIALYSGDGAVFYENSGDKIFKGKRQLDYKDGGFQVRNRQVSSGNSEGIALEKEKRKHIGDDRRKIREELQKPLLMLHVLEAQNLEPKDKADFAAFGISFPGNVLSQDETIKLKINTVFYESLLKELEEEDDE